MKESTEVIIGTVADISFWEKEQEDAEAPVTLSLNGEATATDASKANFVCELIRFSLHHQIRKAYIKFLPHETNIYNRIKIKNKIHFHMKLLAINFDVETHVGCY